MLTSFRLAAVWGTLVLGCFTLSSAACSTTVTTNPFGDLADASTSKNPTDPSGKDGGSSSGGSLCEKFCAKAAPANCSSQPTCEADCKKQIDQAPEGCKDVVEALLECGGGSKGKINGCSSSGKPKLEGCDSETTALLQCVTNPPKKDGGTTTTPKCDQLETGQATCDTCMDSKCCAQETACIDEPDCLPFFDCLGAGTPQATCQAQHPAGYAAALQVNQCMTTQCATPCQ